MITNEFLQRKESSDEASWLSVADMMAGLMMIFLMIAIIFLARLAEQTNQIQGVSDDICQELAHEFSKEKEKWNMSICQSGLLVSFQDESVFNRGQYTLKDEFKKILDEFFPRFMQIILNNQEHISELRIEGHTSSEYSKESKTDSYLLNTILSQKRSYNVMEYAFSLIQSDPEIKWMLKNLTAHGMSSSKLKYNKNSNNENIEDIKMSRRVEFKVQTNAQEKFIDQFNNSFGNLSVN